MMRNRLHRCAMIASMSCFAVAGAASASFVQETIHLGSVTLAGGEHVVIGYDAAGNTDLIVGFKVSFDFDNNNDPFAWASDLLIQWQGVGFAIGGFSSPSDLAWDFEGPGAASPGFYVHLSSVNEFANAPLEKGELTGFKLSNDFGFNDAVSWNNIVLTLYKTPIPAPGALALLGLAGVTGFRRRRR